MRVEGATLIELVVVLTILVALAGTAVLATEGLVDQTRYEATLRTLNGFEEGVIGRAGLVDANQRPWIQGFVADMGRLPVVVDIDGDPAKYLNELWRAPLDPKQHFKLESPPGDTKLLVGAGWRGPYLRPPLGASALHDGWGELLHAYRADGVAAAIGEPIARLESHGAPRGSVDDPYAVDVRVVLESSVEPIVPARWHGDVPVRVTGHAGSGFLVLRVYGSVDGRAGRIGDPLIVDLGAELGEVTRTFVDIPIGARTLGVYQSPAAPAGPDTDLSATSVRRIVPITVVAGAIPEVLVELGAP